LTQYSTLHNVAAVVEVSC